MQKKQVVKLTIEEKHLRVIDALAQITDRSRSYILNLVWGLWAFGMLPDLTKSNDKEKEQ